MNPTTRRAARWALGAFFTVFSFARLASAQQRDEYGEARDEFGEAHQTVARISYVSGSVSFSRGDDPDNWQAADQNVTMSIGDRVYADTRSRVELQVQGGNSIWLGARTDLAALNLTDDTKQFSINGGVASFQIRRLDDNEIFEIDTPNAAATVDQPGTYRVEVDKDGNTRFVVWQGRALVAAGGGQVAVNRGEEMRIDGIDSPRYDVVAAARRDNWDQWVDGRVARFARSRSYQYVSADVVGANDLDDYGQWQDIPEYGHVWTPSAIQVDWAPYRAGHWGWQDPWGWTWLSSEPWGWAPYHYGRWVSWSSRWYWVPVAPSVRYVAYSPALVAFVGGGPGFSASVTIGGGGFVGWFPLGPRDPFNPWWGRRAGSVNVTNVTYVNKTYVTVVNQNTFVSGGNVTNNIIRDRNVLQNVGAAQVLRGPIPMVPTRQALRVSVRTNLPAPVRPPAAVLNRAVVVRSAPPPAPPTFQAKMAVIKENHGAPVAPAAAARISVTERGRAQAVTSVRPVVAESGHVTLTPRGASAAAGSVHKAEPVAPLRGRALATSGRAVSTGPVKSGPTVGGGTSTGTGTSSSQTHIQDRAPRSEIAPRSIAPLPTAAAPRNTPVIDRGRGRNDRDAGAGKTGATTSDTTTTDRKGRSADQGFRGMQPTAPVRAVTPRAGPPVGQGPSQTGGRDRFVTPSDSGKDSQGGGRRRDRVTPVPQPQGGGGAKNTAAESSGRERRFNAPPTQARPQTERVRPNVERAPPPPAPDRSHQKPDNKNKDKEKEKKPTPRS